MTFLKTLKASDGKDIIFFFSIQDLACSKLIKNVGMNIFLHFKFLKILIILGKKCKPSCGKKLFLSCYRYFLRVPPKEKKLCNMHAVRFNISLSKVVIEIENQKFIGFTDVFDSNIIFERA